VAARTLSPTQRRKERGKRGKKCQRKEELRASAKSISFFFHIMEACREVIGERRTGREAEREGGARLGKREGGADTQGR